MASMEPNALRCPALRPVSHPLFLPHSRPGRVLLSFTIEASPRSRPLPKEGARLCCNGPVIYGALFSLLPLSLSSFQARTNQFSSGYYILRTGTVALYTVSIMYRSSLPITFNFYLKFFKRRMKSGYICYSFIDSFHPKNGLKSLTKIFTIKYLIRNQFLI